MRVKLVLAVLVLPTLMFFLGFKANQRLQSTEENQRPQLTKEKTAEAVQTNRALMTLTTTQTYHGILADTDMLVLNACKSFHKDDNSLKGMAFDIECQGYVKGATDAVQYFTNSECAVDASPADLATAMRDYIEGGTSNPPLTVAFIVLKKKYNCGQ